MFIIAIDGPAGSGKSSTAFCVAQTLGFAHLDTVAMHRALTYLALTRGVSFEDESALAELASGMRPRFSAPLSKVSSTAQRLTLDNVDITDAIRSSEVTAHVSQVSAFARVRAELVKKQRAWESLFDHPTPEGIVAEGRDIGSVVFPNANVKVYLDASPETRAARRATELRLAGQDPDERELAAEIARRDARDSSRAHSPLTIASDAMTLDTTHLTMDEQVARVVELARERGARTSAKDSRARR